MQQRHNTMKLINNPFIEHPVYLCCGVNLRYPFIHYVYFIDGVAYASNAYMVLALSLTDIETEQELIDCINGFKIHHSDMELMQSYEYLFPDTNGRIFLNEEKSRMLQLQSFEFNDVERKYLQIPELSQKGLAELETHSENISNIKINLSLLEKIAKSVGSHHNAVRFNFLKNPQRVLLEFDYYENSFAIVMPMMDNV
jgi:hypothetical protein